MHTKTIQKIQKAYIKTYEEDVKIYKDIENSQGTLLLQKCRPLYLGNRTDCRQAQESPIVVVVVAVVVLENISIVYYVTYSIVLMLT